MCLRLDIYFYYDKLVNMRKNTYSLAKIAEKLGVSKTAVSFVVNNTDGRRISEKLEKRIRDFCAKVDYRPNIHAQRMNSSIVKNIGVLIGREAGEDEQSPFREYNVANIVGGIAEEADKAGYQFGFRFYSEGMKKDSIFEWFKNREIDGLIYYGFGIPDEWNRIFSRENFKFVGIAIDPAHGIPCVNVDNYRASFKLAEYLIDKGHSKFIYLGGPPDAYPGSERYKGFRDALRKGNIQFPEENFFCAEFKWKNAETFVRERWIHGGLKEDAIVCANDTMAIGAISALTEARIKIPEEIAVVGADNIALGGFITPTLTTFDNLPFEQGRAAFKLLNHIITGCEAPGNVLLKTTLHLRDSG